MAISVVARKALWGRAGNRCALPSCRCDLMPRVDDATGAALEGAGVIVGEEAHIRSGKPGGPRFDQAHANVDGYENLILLCPTHHALVDKNGGEGWTVERLQRLKAEHEGWVDSRLSQSEKEALRFGLLMAAEVQRLEDLIFERWPGVYWQISQAIPRLRQTDMEALAEAGRLLLAKDWPPPYPRVRVSSERLRQLLRLLLQHLHEHFELRDAGTTLTLVRPEKRIGRWDPPVYARLWHQTELNMFVSWWLIDMLAMELNAWIAAVRADVDPLYRFVEGVLIVDANDGLVHPIQHIRFECLPEEPLSQLPHSLGELKERIDAVATDKGIEVQQLPVHEVRLDPR